LKLTRVDLSFNEYVNTYRKTANYIYEFSSNWEVVCHDGVRRFFKVPLSANRIQFFAYDEPTEYSVKFEIIKKEIEKHIWYELRYGCERAMVMSPGIEAKLEKLYDRGIRTIYVECEYERDEC